MADLWEYNHLHSLLKREPIKSRVLEITLLKRDPHDKATISLPNQEP